MLTYMSSSHDQIGSPRSDGNASTFLPGLPAGRIRSAGGRTRARMRRPSTPPARPRRPFIWNASVVSHPLNRHRTLFWTSFTSTSSPCFAFPSCGSVPAMVLPRLRVRLGPALLAFVFLSPVVFGSSLLPSLLPLLLTHSLTRTQSLSPALLNTQPPLPPNPQTSPPPRC